MTDLENASRARRIALHQIRQLMEFWNIAPEELGHALSVPAAPRHAAPPGYVKYRHPVTGETWDGEGEHPEWLRKALLKDGYRVAELKPEYQQEQALLQQQGQQQQQQAGHAG
jgi:DNA-binding protein H-NS